jgi:hypothetical protein
MSDVYDFGDEETEFPDVPEDVEEDIDEDADPSVPVDLLELHLALEEAEISPEDFKEEFG